MSKLEEYYYYEDRVITPATHCYRVYHADEVDAVLAHQKYKRCMAMAEACRHKRWRGGIGEEGYDYARATRHMNVWLELADKFKEI